MILSLRLASALSLLMQWCLRLWLLLLLLLQLLLQRRLPLVLSRAAACCDRRDHHVPRWSLVPVLNYREVSSGRHRRGDVNIRSSMEKKPPRASRRGQDVNLRGLSRPYLLLGLGLGLEMQMAGGGGWRGTDAVVQRSSRRVGSSCSAGVTREVRIDRGGDSRGHRLNRAIQVGCHVCQGRTGGAAVHSIRHGLSRLSGVSDAQQCYAHQLSRACRAARTSGRLQAGGAAATGTGVGVEGHPDILSIRPDHLPGHRTGLLRGWAIPTRISLELVHPLHHVLVLLLNLLVLGVELRVLLVLLKGSGRVGVDIARRGDRYARVVWEAGRNMSHLRIVSIAHMMR